MASGEALPYKFTSKELDPETGYYSFTHRYYDPKVGKWLSIDPPMVRGEYFPNPNDMDTDHDYYWYGKNESISKLPGMGGVFNPVNLSVYHYAGLNPVKFVDPDGETQNMPMITPADPEAHLWQGKPELHPSGVQVWQPAPTDNPFTRAALGFGDIYPTLAVGVLGVGRVRSPVAGSAIRYGSRGKPDHQMAVSRLFQRFRREAGPGETVLRESRIRGNASRRNPDVQIIDRNGVTRRIGEVERNPSSRRNLLREAEYRSLGIQHETIPLPKKNK